MATISENGGNDYALVHRTLDDNDELTVRLLVIITDTPDTVDVQNVKGIIDAVGSDLTECVGETDWERRNERVDWRQGYKVIPSTQWDDALRVCVTNVKYRSSMTDELQDDWPIVSTGHLGSLVMVDERCQEFQRIVSYADLVDHLAGEKRITLRLPRALHSRLVQRAFDSVAPPGQLNTYCLRTLAEAVGYEDLVDFEAQKRKPGRPKKVQDAE